MLVVHHSPWTRSVRTVWLLEELGLPYELRTVALEPTVPKPYAQRTPFGKVPALEDGDTVMFESGAILEYVPERHGAGRLAPPAGSPQRAAFLQWVRFAETLFTGLGNIAWHRGFRNDEASVPQAIADYRTWTEGGLDLLETVLEGREHVLGDFSAADTGIGYTLLVAKSFGVLMAEAHPRVDAYLARLVRRPALRKALQAGLPVQNDR